MSRTSASSLLLAALLAGCTPSKPAAPIDTGAFARETFTVPADVKVVYSRIEGHLGACPSTGSVFGRTRFAGKLAPDGDRGALGLSRDGRKIAGADLVTTADGTKVTTYSLGNLYIMMRRWAENRAPNEPGTAGIDFLDC